MRYVSLVALLMSAAAPCLSSLQPLTDDELEATDGQAFIGIDQYDQDGIDYTRVNLGLDVKIQMNADEIVFGEYPRPGETNTADIDFKDFALGYIKEGEIVPFEMKDPYIEWAYDRSSGTDDFVGVRFGFGEARGMMSFKGVSFTGNVDVVIAGDYTYHLFGWEWAAIPLQAKGQTALVDATGARDPVRATYIGLPDGTEFQVDNPFYPLGPETIGVGVDDCKLSLNGDDMCFSLTKYESMQIGKPLGNQEYDFVDGLFISFQSQPIKWGRAATGETQIDTVTGAFFNIPRGSVEISPNEARAGTPRVATEFIDRGVGRFINHGYVNGTLDPYPK